MEKLASGRKWLLGSSSFHKSLGTPSSVSSPNRGRSENPEIDFDDVFGGPPRQASFHDPRCNSSEDASSCSLRENEQARLINEKPVFGSEGFHRKYPSKDFFDDIFRRDESSSSTPRSGRDRDPLSPTPGSRVISPAQPLPPSADPFGSSSLPAQFSLPPKLVKGMELPAFGSVDRSLHKNKVTASSVAGSTALMSRFSSPTRSDHNKPISEVGPSSYSRSSLFPELSFGREESLGWTTQDETDSGARLRKESGKSEVSTHTLHFHFSIYKWENSKIPVVRPLRGGRSGRSKEAGDVETWSRSSGGLDSCHTVKIASHETELDKGRNNSVMTSNRNASLEMTEETFLAILESETFVTVQTDKVPTNYMSHAHQEVSSYPLGSCGETDEEFSKPKLPVPHYAKLGNGGETKEPRRYESKTITAHVSAGNSEKGKNLGENGVLNNKVDYDKTQGVPENWEDDLGRKKLKGRVQDFVKVFNQESSSKPKVDVDPQVKTSENENREKHKIKKQTSSGAMGMAAERQMPRLNRKNALPDASVMMNGKFKQMGEENSSLRDTVSNSSYAANRMKNDSASVSAGSKPAANTSECIQEKFVIVQDSQLGKDSENVEDIQFSDDSIRKWSSGKEGNIRSLLSTLQFILWPNSGWKPVPLVDIIEANAVKRAYQKALLCLHPDKLQQKGAASHQKYLAEKVFDILQEAWTQFSSLGSL